MSTARLALYILAGIAAVVLASLVVRACILYSERTPSDLPTVPPKAEEPEERPVTVTLERLGSDYDENEVAADRKYKGRVLLISASVSAIEKDLFGEIVLRLRSGESAASAFLDQREEEKAAAVRKGDRISLVCRGVACRSWGSPRCANAESDRLHPPELNADRAGSG